jgi:K+-transporting ATPase c subunit
MKQRLIHNNITTSPHHHTTTSTYHHITTSATSQHITPNRNTTTSHYYHTTPHSQQMEQRIEEAWEKERTNGLEAQNEIEVRVLRASNENAR